MDMRNDWHNLLTHKLDSNYQLKENEEIDFNFCIDSFCYYFNGTDAMARSTKKWYLQ